MLSRVKKYCSLLIFLVFIFTVSQKSLSQDLDVPYVPTPQSVVDRMLEIAGVHPGDYVIDLGSGDGRIVIAAAKKGAFGHGVDLDPERVSEAKENARKAGVDNRVVFLQQNIFDTDIRQASVITMYLLPDVNRKLRPRLFDMLEPGTRVVSHSFTMGEWRADQSFKVETEDGSRHDVYFWIIPADVSGIWEWSVDNRRFTLNVNQEYQQVQLAITSGTDDFSIREPVIRGKRFSFTAENDDTRYVFSGRVEGDRVSGTVQIHAPGEDQLARWDATRVQE